MIDEEILLTFLKNRVAALDKFIAGHQEKIKACDPADSEKMRMHMESIGKLRARQNECESFKLTIQAIKK